MSKGRRYSKVSRRMWNDAGFRELSVPPPNAQTLWFRLLTGPELTNIPGLFEASEAGLADALGWPVEAFREAFREVSAKAMAKADWEARLVWVPQAIRHNPPEAPNVVKAWEATWDLLPECELKTQAWRHLRDWCKARGKSYPEAFRKACPKPSGKAWAIQEQEQEQEQESNARARDHLSPLDETERLTEYAHTLVLTGYTDRYEKHTNSAWAHGAHWRSIRVIADWAVREARLQSEGGDLEPVIAGAIAAALDGFFQERGAERIRYLAEDPARYAAIALEAA